MLTHIKKGPHDSLVKLFGLENVIGLIKYLVISIRIALPYIVNRDYVNNDLFIEEEGRVPLIRTAPYRFERKKNDG